MDIYIYITKSKLIMIIWNSYMIFTYTVKSSMSFCKEIITSFSSVLFFRIRTDERFVFFLTTCSIYVVYKRICWFWRVEMWLKALNCFVKSPAPISGDLPLPVIPVQGFQPLLSFRHYTHMHMPTHTQIHD